MIRLVFGCGYLGERVAHQWREAGDTVYVVTRSMESAMAYREHGYETVVADVTKPGDLRNLPEADTVLFAVGYDRTSDDSIEEVYAGGMKNVLAALPSTVERFIYISTTGVYGNAEGELVDESVLPQPQRSGGKASLAAEHLLGEKFCNPSHSNRQAITLRLAGIYGPGRIPYLDKLEAGEPISAPSKGWLNLIHVDDAASITIAADRWLSENDPLPSNTQPNEAAQPFVMNVSDGSPVVRGDYYAEVARLVGASPPKFATPAPDSPAAARALANKRISNAKLVETLTPRFRYPSYREGLKAALA